VFLSGALILFQAMNPILASALIPGWGESIIGKKNQAKAFFVVEGTLWLSYAGFTYFGHKGEASSRAFAIEHGSANPGRSDADYFDILEDYMTADDYNIEVERNASYYYPDDPARQQQYIEENGFFGADAWSWDTVASRNQDWKSRRSARANLQRASFMTGFALVNRLVSVINVAVLNRQERFGLESRDNRIGIYFKF
jgi:hypothetical protein